MDLAVFCDGCKLQKHNFLSEEEFEREIKLNYRKLFGERTIYLDLKKKIEAVSLGGSIPDGILLDVGDPDDIKFYLVEVELASHDFYRHIFPQITKFFAFYKNSVSQNNLIEKIYSFIINNTTIKNDFERLLDGREMYKSIKDAIENNQKILLIVDDEKDEIYEAQEVYTDTWDKLVIPEILSKYKQGEKEVFILDPDFSEEELLIRPEDEEQTKEVIKYTESYHLEGVDPSIASLYFEIKDHMIKLDSQINFNPQKYYISFRKTRNFSYLSIKKKKIKIAVMLPYEKGVEMIKKYRLRKFTEGVQRFYGRSSFEITVENNENLEEVLNLLEEAYREQL